VESSWKATESLRPGILLDEFIVMPNHMHAIIHLPKESARRALFSLVGGFKSEVTSEVRRRRSDATFNGWQKRFNDHIIRSDHELERIREYIRANPARWCGLDPEFGTAQPCRTPSR